MSPRGRSALKSSKWATELGRRRLTVRFADEAIDTAGLTTARRRQVDDELTALLCSASIVLARRVQSLVFRFVECARNCQSTVRRGCGRREGCEGGGKALGLVDGKGMNEILEKSGDEARREDKDAENKSRTFRRAEIRDPFAPAPRDVGDVS